MAQEAPDNTPRLPLAVPVLPRDATNLDKDSFTRNAYLDSSKSGRSFVNKRPGFYVGSEAITTGLNRGIYVNPNNPTGGTPGQTQIWYIPSTGGGNLTSFTGTFLPPEPPADAEGFQDFSFSITTVPPDPVTLGVAEVFESSSTNVRIGVGWGVSEPTSSTVIVLEAEQLDGTNIVAVSTGVIPIKIGTFFLEVKRELPNLNLYLDSVLTLSLPVALIPAIVTPSLSYEIAPPPFTGISSITDLQFI